MSRRRVQDTQEQSTVKKIQQEHRREKKIARKKRRRRFLKRTFYVLLVAGIIAGIIWFDSSEYSKIDSVEIKGNQIVSTEVIKETFGIKEGDRILKAMFKSIGKKPKVPGIANMDVKLYYTKRRITLTVQENTVVGYSLSPTSKVLFKDNSYVEVEHINTQNVPLLVGFDDDIIKQYPKMAEKLSVMNPSSFNGISEIHKIEEPLESMYFKLIMNNGYFVFTNLDNLLLMDYYPDIVSGIQSGENSENRCIYFLDQGNTPETQSAVSKPCGKEN